MKEPNNATIVALIFFAAAMLGAYLGALLRIAHEISKLSL